MKQYRHFEQGDGDLLNLPVKVNEVEVNAVGTYRCRTCLCVYVRFENNHVFIAHMVASTPSFDFSDAGNIARWVSEPEKGKQLQAAVVEQLRATLSSDDPVAEVFVICPAISWDGDEANGYYMREAVVEFFEGVDVVTHYGHGFVAGPGVETVQFQRLSSDGSIETANGIEKVLANDARNADDVENSNNVKIADDGSENTDTRTTTSNSSDESADSNKHAMTQGSRYSYNSEDVKPSQEKPPADYGWESANGVLTEQQFRKHPTGPWTFRNIDGRWKVGP